MRFLKTISKWVWVAIIVLLAVFLLQKWNVIPSFRSVFRSQPVIIDETSILIKEIRTIAELNTASLYHEFVIDSTQPSLLPLNALKKRIVLIAKGKVTAGINLGKIDSSRIYVKDDSVSMQLPSARITSIELNPSSFETFYENGRWSSAEVTAVKLRARTILLQEAEKRKLLQKAGDKALASMTDFLAAAGFKRIHLWIGNY